MARKSASSSGEPMLAPVDDYPEKTDDVRTLAETLAAEQRDFRDQDPDYTANIQRLDTSGPEHDPAVAAALIEEMRQSQGKEAVKANLAAEEEAAAEG